MERRFSINHNSNASCPHALHWITTALHRDYAEWTPTRTYLLTAELEYEVCDISIGINRRWFSPSGKLAPTSSGRKFVFCSQLCLSMSLCGGGQIRSAGPRPRWASWGVVQRLTHIPLGYLQQIICSMRADSHATKRHVGVFIFCLGSANGSCSMFCAVVLFIALSTFRGFYALRCLPNNYAASSTFLACLDFILGLFGVIGFNVFSQLKFFFAVVFIFFKFILLFLILCWFTYCLRLIICYCHYFVSLICSIILLCCISPLFLLNKQLRSLFILYSLSNSDDFVNCDAVLSWLCAISTPVYWFFILLRSDSMLIPLTPCYLITQTVNKRNK